MFLGRGVLKICSTFTGESPCRSVVSVKLQSNFIEITLQHGGSAVNLLRIFKTPFPKNTSGGLLLKNNEQLKIVNYFRKKLYHRRLTVSKVDRSGTNHLYFLKLSKCSGLILRRAEER